MYKRKINKILDDKLNFEVDTNKYFEEFKKVTPKQNKETHILKFKLSNFLLTSCLALIMIASIASISTYYITKNLYEDNIHHTTDYDDRMINSANEYFNSNDLPSITLPNSIYYIDQDYAFALYENESLINGELTTYYQIYSFTSAINLNVNFIQDGTTIHEILISEESTIGSFESIEGINIENNEIAVEFYRNNHLLKFFQIFY